jgi:hypothetical protein
MCKILGFRGTSNKVSRQAVCIIPVLRDEEAHVLGFRRSLGALRSCHGSVRSAPERPLVRWNLTIERRHVDPQDEQITEIRASQIETVVVAALRPEARQSGHSSNNVASFIPVWLVIFTLGAAILVVIGTGGKFSELVRLRFASAWTLGAGIGLQALLEIIELPKDQFDTLGYGLLMLSYVFLLAFCLTNVWTRGFGVIAIGVAMNALVIGLNQGMPTIDIGNDANGNRIQKPVETTVKHRPERDDDLARFLDDQILLPEPFDAVVSFGDLVLGVGICELAYFGSRRRRRRGRASTGQSSVGANPRRSKTRSKAPSTRPS